MKCVRSCDVTPNGATDTVAFTLCRTVDWRMFVLENWGMEGVDEESVSELERQRDRYLRWPHKAVLT